MSTTYHGKLNFTERDLTTKYDNISFKTTTTLNPIKSVDDNSRFFYSNKLITKFSHIHINRKCNNGIKENTNLESDVNSINISLEEWMNLMQHEDFEDFNTISGINANIKLQGNFCKECTCQSQNTEIFDNKLHIHKKDLLNLVLQSILYGLKDYSKFISICIIINKSDPEFILKISLFCRNELNIRTISNFLIGLASYLIECRVYLQKYFNTIVNLPTDWIEIVYYYILISDSTNFPNQLRKVLINKFMDFSIYQIGKYQNKNKAVDVNNKTIKLTIKNLIRILHISEPIEHVMPLLGKKYPTTNEDFISSKLPGQWDESKSGKRMKIPIPNTWETQLGIHGNKPEVWEKLIDTKSLPYMAMIRNLRNILQSNLKDNYHVKVTKYISNQSNIMKSRLLPFQYFTAFKILEQYNEDILKAQEKLDNKSWNKQKKLDRRSKLQKIIRLKKITSRSAVSDTTIKKYTNALNKAVAISTIYNIPPIKGKVCIISNITDRSMCSTFKYGSTKTVREVVALLTSMCCFASENVDIYLVKDTTVSKFKQNPRHRSILDMTEDILSSNGIGDFGPCELIDNMVTSQIRFDLILIFDVNLPRKLLVKYTNYVNPSVLIFMNSCQSNLEEISNFEIENIFHLSGFSEHSLRIISEQNNGDIIKRINAIDRKYNLTDINEYMNVKPKVMERIPDFYSTQREINIFISSTFMDMDRERSIINKLIMPAIKRNIALNYLNIVDINCIDLRWGIPNNWDRSERLLQYCIEQVKRCHIFIGVLGSRYGWIPESNIINKLSGIYPELKEFEGLSVTNIEYKFASSNCEKVFFLKLDETKTIFDNEKLKLFRDEIMSKESFYNYSSENLPNEFNAMISHLTKIISEKILPKNLLDASICENHKFKFRLQKIISETHNFLKYYTGNIESFQKQEVKQIIYIMANKQINSNNISELISVKKDRLNAKEMKKKQVALYTHECGFVFVIEGKPGSGKTSLLAELISQSAPSQMSSTSYKKLNYVWIFDVIKSLNSGISKDIYLFDLLYDMIEYFIRNLEANIISRLKKELEIYNNIPNQDFWRPSNIKSALVVWNAILKLINSIKEVQISIFIDGIDQLKDSIEASTLNWVPLHLPARFRIILTTLCDSKLIFASRLRKDTIIHQILPIPILYKKDVIKKMLKKHGKTLDSVPFNNYISEFILKRDSANPLFLKIAVNQLLLYTSFDNVKESIKNLPSTLDYLILHSLKSIENEIPREFCFVYFAFLSNCKSGFKLDDLQMLMSIYFRVAITKNKCLLTGNDYNKLKSASKLPVCFSIYPLVLIKNLSSLLLYEDTNSRIFIKDEYIKILISRYTISIDTKIINFIISIYYENLMSTYNDKIAYRDIIFYKYSSQLFDECVDLLINIKYLKQRFELGVAEEITKDYAGYGDLDYNTNNSWHNICDRQDFEDFKNFIINNLNFLLKYPNLFLQQALNEPPTSFVNIACSGIVIVPFEFQDCTLVILKKKEVIINETEIASMSFLMDNKISATALALKINLVAIGFHNGLIQLCNVKTFQILHNLRKHLLKVNKIMFFEADAKLISVGEDCKVYIWNSVNGTLLKELIGHHQPVTDCIFSGEANAIGTVSLDYQFILWNSGSYIQEQIFKTKSPINCVSKHPINDFKVMLGCWNGSMIIYNVLDYKRIAVLHNDASIKSISFHPNYELLLSSDIIGQIFIWNSKIGIKVKTISIGNPKFFSYVHYSSDGLHFTEFSDYCCQPKGANVWSTAIGYHADSRALADVTCIDSNDSYIVCGNKFGKVIVLTNNLKQKFEESICNLELTSICLQHCNRSKNVKFATVDYNRDIYIVEILENKILIKFQFENVHSSCVNVMYFSSNFLISGGEDCSVSIIEIEASNWKSLIPSIRDLFIGSILSINVFDDLLLIGSKDKSIGLFNIEKEIILNHKIKAHDDWVTSVSFSSSDIFISGSNDFSMKIWNICGLSKIDHCVFESFSCWNRCRKIVSFKLLHVLVNHIGSITSISIHNKELFASSSSDGTIKLWNTEGVFIDDVRLEENYSSSLVNRVSIIWMKFRKRCQTLFALDSKLKLHVLDLNRTCLINILNNQKSVNSVFDFENYLYTVSFDGSIRKWSLVDIFQNKFKHITQFKITHSLHFSSIRKVSDVIVAITDNAILVFFANNGGSQDHWVIIDTFDLKPHYRKTINYDTSAIPFLLCRSFRKVNEHEIIIEFGKLTMIYDVHSKSIKMTLNNCAKAFDDSESTIGGLQEMITEETCIEIAQHGGSKYLIRFNKKFDIMEFILLKTDKGSPIVLSKVPVNGYPCHAMAFVSRKDEHLIFIAYIQGNIDIVEFKKFLHYN